MKLAGVQIDLEGAFENCSGVYLKDLLELMGLGPTFLRWVGCLWVGMSGRISYGGKVKNRFFTENLGLSI